MASTSEKVRPVEEEAYAPENYADVFPELPQAPPLEVTQWPAKTPAAWKTNVRPSKCTQVRISLQNYMVISRKKNKHYLDVLCKLWKVSIEISVILVWQYFSSTFHMNNALWGWLFFLSWLKRGIFFNGLNFYLNRYSLSLWKREDSRKWMRIVLVMKDKLNRQKSAKKSWLSMVNFQAEFHHKLSFFMEFVNHTKRI